MRTTVQIDDDLLEDLKQEAHREGTSLAKMVNRVLRRGIQVVRRAGKARAAYREKTFSMGQPKVALDKALALAAMMEDEEILQKIERRK
jgi:uncharacterized protein GlcG (DUF336 family)